MSKQIAPFALETFGCQTFVSNRICAGRRRGRSRAGPCAAASSQRAAARAHLWRSKGVIVRQHDVYHEITALVRRALLQERGNAASRVSAGPAALAGLGRARTAPGTTLRARRARGTGARTGPRSDPFQCVRSSPTSDAFTGESLPCFSMSLNSLEMRPLSIALLQEPAGLISPSRSHRCRCCRCAGAPRCVRPSLKAPQMNAG
jgi:hypothetical protein